MDINLIKDCIVFETEMSMLKIFILLDAPGMHLTLDYMVRYM